jgi:tetratricopeptide (TPR) repeat protein
MRKLLYLIAFVVVSSLGGCTLPKMIKLAKEQNLQVNPNPLEVHKDTVAFDMAANLPVKMLAKGTSYTVNSFYKYGDNESALESIVFRAEDFPNSGTEEPKVNKSFSFPYSPAMKSGMLEVEGVAAKGAKSKTTPRMSVAPGVITTSQLVQPSYYAAYSGHGYNNQEELEPTTVNFFFDQGRSNLKTSERASSRGKQFEAFIAEKNVTRTVTITGTHSPEGAERINSRLSQDRAKVIEDYYRQQMRRYDYKGLANQIQFILKPVIEDWNDFKKAMADYNGITAEEKSQYLNIVNGGGTFEEKERQLRQLGTYKKVFKDLYPGLRSAKTEILTVKDKKTDAEISVLAKQVASGSQGQDALSFAELMYAATLTPALDEKVAIYTAATKYGTNWNAHNNLGATYIAQFIEGGATNKDLLNKAQAQLDIAAKIKETAEVHANLSTLSLANGNAYKAASHASKSLSMGANNEVSAGVNGVKGASEIMTAKYTDAVRSTSSAQATAVNLYNKGLAQLLNNNFQNAVSSFDEAIKKDAKYADAYYGAAIAHARLNNLDSVIRSLTEAVKLEPALKQTALNDLEFRNYAANELFRNALR